MHACTFSGHLSVVDARAACIATKQSKAKQASKQTNKQTNKETTNKQTNKQTNIVHVGYSPCCWTLAVSSEKPITNMDIGHTYLGWHEVQHRLGEALFSELLVCRTELPTNTKTGNVNVIHGTANWKSVHAHVYVHVHVQVRSVVVVVGVVEQSVVWQQQTKETKQTKQQNKQNKQSRQNNKTAKQTQQTKQQNNKTTKQNKTN